MSDHTAMLREERQKAWQECRAILDRCVEERRERTPAEAERFTAANDRLDRLTRELGDYDRMAREPAPVFRSAYEDVINPDTVQRESNRMGEALAEAVHAVSSGQLARAFVSTGPEARMLAGNEVRTLSTDGDGGLLVPVDLKAPGQTLRAKSVMLGMPGINVVPMTSGRSRFPRFGDDTTYQVAEGGTITPSDGDIDAVDLVAQKFVSYRILTSEEIEDATSQVLSLVGENLLKSLALKVDLAMLEGTSGGIVGIRNTPGINSTSVAGTPADFDKFQDTLYEALADNANPTRWVMHPRTWNTLSKIKTGITSDKTTLLEPSPQAAPRALLSLPVDLSTQITLTEGATNVGSWVGAIDPSQLIIGERVPPVLEVTREIYFETDRVGVRARARYGFGAFNPEGISIATDVRA